MIEEVAKKFAVNKEDIVVLGDRLYTDIASGVNAGVDTVLVLSGEATLKDYEESEVKSEFVLTHVKELNSLL
jgi:ribonucleotide monophosphatase NagD (HAD superfamily)